MLQSAFNLPEIQFTGQEPGLRRTITEQAEESKIDTRRPPNLVRNTNIFSRTRTSILQT